MQAAELQEVSRIAAAAHAACDALQSAHGESEPQDTSTTAIMPGGPTTESGRPSDVIMHTKAAIGAAAGGRGGRKKATPADEEAPRADDAADPPTTAAAQDALLIAPDCGPVNSPLEESQQPGDAAMAVRGVLGLLHSCLQRMRADSSSQDAACDGGSKSAPRTSATTVVASDARTEAADVAELQQRCQQLLAERDALLDHIMENQVCQSVRG